MLTTTQAANILRCSRQHVVRMCDRGEIPSTRVGTHRRIRRRDLDALLHPPLRREDERSLWLHLAIAGKLVVDPDGVIGLARQRLALLRTVHQRAGAYLDQWERALDAGPEAVIRIMVGRDDTAQALRSASPMTGLGLLTNDERHRILAAFRSHWGRAVQVARLDRRQ